MSGKEQLYSNLRQFIGIIDQLRDLGLSKIIQLPRIATLGGQSSGKSSLLESIVGMDFLPRGEGICTRRPLELRLIHVAEETPIQPYGIFEEIPGQKFTNFNEIRNQINNLTDKVAGQKKNIVDQPIVLTVHSNSCPDLTLIDLPGITRVPLTGSDQPNNIEEITKKMCYKYVSDERTIILAVTAANQDLSTSDALQMARQVDPQGKRTLGAITKIDIMDKGTDAKKILMGQEVHLKLGYVGVKNRNQDDINKNKKVSEALDEERLYFSKHPIYSTLPQHLLGANNLTQKLTKILFHHIKTYLPDILKDIQQKLDECQIKLRELGEPLPSTLSEKQQVVWDLVTRFCSQFRNSLEGKYSTNNLKTLPEGAQIRLKFFELYEQFIPDVFTPSKEYSDKQITRAIKKHEGDKLPGFHSADPFLSLLQPILDRLVDPAQECLSEVYILIESICIRILKNECRRFPELNQELEEKVLKILDEQREQTKLILEDVLYAETKYIFTNEQDFSKNLLEKLIQKEGLQPQIQQQFQNPAINQQNQQGQQPNSTNKQQPQQQQQMQPDPALQVQPITEERVKQLMIQEMRIKMDMYFKIVIKTVRDKIPKIIGHYFVKNIQNNIQMILIQQLNEDKAILKTLEEPKHIKEERDRLMSMIEILKNSQKAIKRDPNLSSFLSSQAFQKKFDDKNSTNQTQSTQIYDPMYEKLQAQEKQQQQFQKQQPTNTMQQPNYPIQQSIQQQQQTSQQKTNMFGMDSKKETQQSSAQQLPIQGSQPNLQQDPNRKPGGLSNIIDNQIDKGVDTMFANQQFQNQMKQGANVATQQAVNNALGDKTGNSVFGKLAGNLAEKVVANDKVQNAAKDQVKNKAKEKKTNLFQ